MVEDLPAPSRSLRIVASTSAYEVAIDPGRLHLRMTLLGIWDVATGEAFAREVITAIERLRRAGVALGTFRTLVDASAAAVMPQGAVLVLQQLTLSHGAASERIAFLLHGMLQKMQVQRATPEGMMVTFFDRTEALAWLFAD